MQDAVLKDIYPVIIDIGKMGATGVATVYTGPYGPAVAAPINLVLEAAKQKSINYDMSSYTWENAFVDAAKKNGIDLVAGMGAKKMSQVIAEALNLSGTDQFILEKSLSTYLNLKYLFKEEANKIIEKP